MTLKLRVGLALIVILVSTAVLVTHQTSETIRANVSNMRQPYNMGGRGVEQGTLKVGLYVNPFSFGSNPPKPTGLASYGILNASGLISGYTVRFSTLLGELNLSAIRAYYPNASSYNVSEYGASLQLNAMLVVNSSEATQVYWAQNVVVFLTNNNTLFYADNIWNMSGVGATLKNNTITSSSGGYVTNSSRGPVYAASSNNYTYKLPLSLKMVMSVRVIDGLGVQVGMGIQVEHNDSLVGGTLDWYDNATIHTRTARAAYFLVDGDKLTPPNYSGAPGFYYDAELVFGGEANGAPTNFTLLNATLGLAYLAEDGVAHRFPSYYSFGGDTAEASYDLHVKYVGGGLATVGVGPPNYEYLDASNAPTNMTPNTSSNPTTPSSSTSFEEKNTTLSGSPTHYYLQVEIILVAIATMLLMGVALRHRKAPQTQAASP
ncbi:MAG: thermopsin [Thermoprotei archaeon]